jgi:hypothetical protein
MSTHYLDWCTLILFGWLCSWSYMCLHVYSKTQPSQPAWLGLVLVPLYCLQQDLRGGCTRRSRHLFTSAGGENIDYACAQAWRRSARQTGSPPDASRDARASSCTIPELIIEFTRRRWGPDGVEFHEAGPPSLARSAHMSPRRRDAYADSPASCLGPTKEGRVFFLGRGGDVNDDWRTY